MPQIRTVDELVSYLKEQGVAFVLDDGGIRAKDMVTPALSRCCPLAAVFGGFNMLAHRRATEHGMSERTAKAIILAADNRRGHDPSIRAKLLTLVE